MSLRELRPHQVKAMDGLKASLRAKHRRPMLSLPTGSGKTVVAAHIVAGARSKGNRVTFCVPSLSLIDQTFARFVENGIDPGEIGVIQSDHPWRRPHAPVQIATAQTLARRKFPECDVVVIDEAHVRFGVYERWMSDPAMANKPFIGLSATPWAKGLGLLFDDLVKPISMAELIAQGYLAQFRVFAPSHPDLTGVKTLAGDYQEDQLGEAMSKPKLIADVVETWLAKAGGAPTLCFAVNRAHAQKLADEFAKSGVKVAYVDAYTEREERAAIGAALAAGEIQVVVNIGTLTTGVDWDVRCIILARPTKSESLLVQICGRGLRPLYPQGFDAMACTDAERFAALASVKPYCLILDHSDTISDQLGMPDEIDHDALSIGKAGKSEADDEERAEKPIPLPTACAACGCLIAPGVRECPGCGHVRVRPSGVIVEEGALEELGRGGQRKGKPTTSREILVALGRQEVWAQIKGMQARFGWSDGRCAHTYRDIFGVWPNGMSDEEPVEPSAALRAFVRAKAIAYAKGRQHAA